MENKGSLVKQSIVTWGLMYIILMAVVCFFFIYRKSVGDLLAWIFIIVCVLCMAILLYVPLWMRNNSPLEVDFDRRVVTLRNPVLLSFVTKKKTKVEINFDDITDISGAGLQPIPVFMFSSVTVYTKDLIDSSLNDKTKEGNANMVGLYYLTLKSRKEVSLLINRLKTELNLK